MCRTEHPARRMETDFNMTKDDGMWKIKHIYDGDYGCEERDQDDRAMVSVTLLQDTGEEKIVSVEDAWLTDNALDIGSVWPEQDVPHGTYHFWGWEHADAPAINSEYKGINTPVDLYDALSEIWCAQTCAPRMRASWSKENKTLGQCSITAFLAQDIFGGKVYGILRPDGNYHCYNVIGDCKFDLTSEQFGDEVLNYENSPEQFREVHFAKEEKRLRYEYLKKELKKYCEKKY